MDEFIGIALFVLFIIAGLIVVGYTRCQERIDFINDLADEMEKRRNKSKNKNPVERL